MAQIIDVPSNPWTALDLVERFGPIPLYRICQHPAPGTATERDVLELHDRENRLCELVDGVLVEKTMGTYEAYLAAVLVRLVGNFVEDRKLGIVLGADGMLRLSPGMIRIPDVSFISRERLRKIRLRKQRVARVSPDLAIEILSPDNTREEMERKLREYFDAGVRLVWYVYPVQRKVHVYTSPDQFRTVIESEPLDGGDVLPGFQLDLREFFAEPGE